MKKQPATNLASIAKPLPVEESHLALPGGGARGAWQAGVIVGLLMSGHRFKTISGASAGTLNGIFLADALEKFGWDEPERIGDHMLECWQTLALTQFNAKQLYTKIRNGTVGEGGILSGLTDRVFQTPLNWAEKVEMAASSGFMGAVGFVGQAGGRLGHQAATWVVTKLFEDKLEKMIDFDAIRNATDGPELYFSATDMNTVEEIVYTRPVVTKQVAVASCSIPILFPEKEYEGRSLGDGATLSNPHLHSAIKQGGNIIYAEITPSGESGTYTRPALMMMESSTRKEVQGGQHINALLDRVDGIAEDVRTVFKKLAQRGLENEFAELEEKLQEKLGSFDESRVFFHKVPCPREVRSQGVIDMLHFNRARMKHTFKRGIEAALQWDAENRSQFGKRSTYVPKHEIVHTQPATRPASDRKTSRRRPPRRALAST